MKNKSLETYVWLCTQINQAKNSPTKTKKINLKNLLCFLVLLFAVNLNAQVSNVCFGSTNIDSHNCQPQTMTFSSGGYDKWFSFTADSTQELIVIKGQVGATYAQINSINFYSGNCFNLTPVYSYTLNPLDSQNINRPLIGLIRAHTYYIQVNYSTTANPTQITICKAPLNRTETSCSSGCTIIGESFTDLATITNYCHQISIYNLGQCPYYLNPFVVSGTASGNGTIPSFVPCWTAPPWGTPQIMHSSVSNSDFAFMWSRQASATELAGEAISIQRTFNANSLYILKYDYSTEGHLLDNLFVDLLPTSTPLPASGGFPLNFVGATYWSGGIPIDNIASANTTPFITRQLSFTLPTTVTRKLTFYPLVNSSTTTPYVEQYLDIDNVILYEVTAVPTASSKTLTCAGTATLNANPCANVPANTVTYSWAPATGLSSTTGTTVTASPPVTTIYTLTATSGTCSISGTITITVPPTPPCPVISGSLCANASNTLTISNADPTVLYNWSPAVTYVPGNPYHSTVIINNPNANTVYTVTAIYANCAGSSSKSAPTNTCCTCSSTISVNPAPYNPTFSGTSCTGQTIMINSPDNAIDNYIWNPSVNCLNSNCSQVTANTSTVYTVTAINPNLSCQSTSTIHINTTPPLIVTPTTTTICSGNSVSLNMSSSAPFATHEWSTNTGIICQPCNNTVVSPLTTTTYMASVTAANGCVASQSVLVNVNQSPTVYINNNPAPPVICTQDVGSVVYLTATSSVNTYNWTASQNPTGLSCTACSSPVAAPSVTTTYTVTTTDPATGCSGQDVVTVTVQPCQCGNRSTPAYQGHPNITSPVVFAASASYGINTNLTITGNVTLSNKTFYFAPNVSITVTAGSTLTLDHCHLLACSDMWQGIIASAGSNLIVENNSMIEDAMEAINCSSWLQPATSNSLTVDGCVFNRNKTGINLNNYTFANQFPATIKNAVFTCRILPANVFATTWVTAATPVALKTTVNVPALQAPYNLANNSNYIVTTLKAPLQTLYSNYGIYLNNVGSSNTNGTSTLPSVYNDVTIGNSTATTNNSNLNLFDGLYYGVFSNTSNFTCINNAFELMHSYLFIGVGCLKCPPPVSPYPSAGTAIYATNTALSATNFVFNRAQVIYPSYVPSINPNTNHTNYFTPTYNNKFYDCVTAVNAINYQEVHVAGTDIRSTQHTNPPISFVPLPGSYGILVNSPAYKYNYFRYNLITNISNGISFTASSLSTSQSIGLVSADYNNITAYLNNNPTTQYVSNAIALDNSINCYSNTAICHRNAYFSVSANKNNIQNVYRGIEMSNWIGGHFGEKKTIYNISADTNYISLILNPSSGTPATQFGIAASHCFQHEININNIYGTSTSFVNNQAIRGVYPKDNANSTVQCNNITNVGRGFDFEGQSTGTFGANDPTVWANNSMQNNGNGFRLTNACILGSQGYSGSASDNQWNGATWTGTNYGTYVDAASNAANSPLFVQYASPYYPPNNYSFYPNADYVNTPNAIQPATASGYVCGTIPQAPCTRCPIINGSTIAERVVLDSLIFPLLAAENSYKAQLKYFKMIAMNDTLADSSVVLQNFFTANQSSNLGIITAIETNLAQGNTTTAKSMNTALAPSNVIENNYQKFYTSAINVADTVYTNADSLTLITLANSCPATNGDVVYSARALYNAVNNQYQYFEDNCNYDSLLQTPSARLSKKDNTGFTNLSNKQSSYLVYPNPTTGNFYISSGNTNDKELYIEIQDLTGRIISKQTLTINNGVVSLQNILVNGVYMINIKGADGKLTTKKLIVNN